MDYMDWRGDITFEQDRFNVIDALIMSQLSYVDFENVGLDAGSRYALRMQWQDALNNMRIRMKCLIRRN